MIVLRQDNLMLCARPNERSVKFSADTKQPIGQNRVQFEERNASLDLFRVSRFIKPAQFFWKNSLLDDLQHLLFAVIHFFNCKMRWFPGASNLYSSKPRWTLDDLARLISVSQDPLNCLLRTLWSAGTPREKVYDGNNTLID